MALEKISEETAGGLLPEELFEKKRLETLKRQHKKRLLMEEVQGTLMASGPFVGFLLFSLVPMLVSLILSFTQLNSSDITTAKWVGFGNYVRIFQEKLFYKSIFNTLYYCLNVLINLVVSIFLANLLSKGLHGSTFTRTILFVPSVCSSVAITLMWTWIFNEKGVLNTVLGFLHLGRIGFISTSQWFMPSTLVITVWMYGTNIILLQTALANVDVSLKEAAKIDGASDIRIFYSVVLPTITPTIFYLLITNTVRSIAEVGLMQLITSNDVGPNYSALTLSYYMDSYGFGMASALSWIMAVGIGFLTVLNFKMSKKWVNYD